MKSKKTFRLFITGVVFSVFLIFISVNFIFFTSLMKNQIRMKFIDENRYISRVTEELIDEEKNRMMDYGIVVKNYERAHFGVAEGIFFDLDYDKIARYKTAEGVFSLKPVTKLSYMTLANTIKNGITNHDDGKNIILIGKDKKILGYTLDDTREFLDTGNEEYINDLVTNKNGDYAGLSFLQERNGKIFVKAAVPALNYMHEITGIYVVGKTLDSSFLDNLKMKTNKDIFLIKDNEIISSTIYDNGSRITGIKIKKKLTEPRTKIDLKEFEKGINNHKEMKKRIKHFGTDDGYFEMQIAGRDMGINYFPLYDYNKKLIGFIGVGFSLGIITDMTHEGIMGFVLYSAVFAFLLLIMLVKGLKKGFKPFENIMVLFEKLSQGKYERIDVKAYGELKMLVDSANILTETIELRESQLKDANRELEELNRELEEKVEERTYELKETIEALQKTKSELIDTIDKMKKMQEQLVASEKMASIGKLAGGIAHEVNSPLGAILTSAQSIKLDADFINQPEEKSSITEGVTIIETAVKKVRDIISKLLIFTNKGGERKEVINISKLLDAIVQDLKEDYSLEGINLLAELEENVIIEGSGLEFSQAIKGIIANGRDACLRKRSPNMEIKVNLKNNADNITISIADNGSGIKESDKNRVFDPFFTTKDIGKGLGLNLSVGREILKKHNGSITFESTENIGTVFNIIIEKSSS